ncbi:hypothetical protein DPEC_G00178140 [Dallia pectoralis]|uniref:Uncharacterized protein n=1 Tax=Dallia pectoralis TaxID=75939 RepID=A0ACC2GF22_DALPE|nr:hypothetical protein DPEC_G00178140 [Dallia pectoralis]
MVFMLSFCPWSAFCVVSCIFMFVLVSMATGLGPGARTAVSYAAITHLAPVYNQDSNLHSPVYLPDLATPVFARSVPL